MLKMMVYELKRRKKQLAISICAVFVLLQIVAVFHAYKFTHFTLSTQPKTQSPAKLSMLEKGKTLLLGINNPKPISQNYPTSKFEKIELGAESNIVAWYIPVENAKGTVLLFHGYSGEKSQMLGKSNIFNELNFSTLLVDFQGSGESFGVNTTLGFYEAEQVLLAYEFVRQLSKKKIYLFGTSMGSVAIMKAIKTYQLTPNGIIIECPFGSMYSTVAARFRNMHVPVFPMAGLLTFWGGIINGFWAFDHNPIEYAKEISCPTLLMYGGKDETVSLAETNLIFSNLKGKKQLRIYPEAKHENYLLRYKNEWRTDVDFFLNK